MQISLFQTDILWADPVRNRERAESALLSAPQSDVYVLPEMWDTGFVVDPESLPDERQTAGRATLDWMKAMAQRLDAAVCGSVAVRDEATLTYRNRFYFVSPQSVATYDKHHLFSYGGEQQHYAAGEGRTIVEWRGVRFLLQVCYDLRFPTWSRNGLDSDGKALYDCMLYVASWPTSRIEAWHALLRARAIENQCYVCGVNRVGKDPACPYCGGSEVIDPYGRVAAACQPDCEQVLTVGLDLNRLQSFRQKFPVLADAD